MKNNISKHKIKESKILDKLKKVELTRKDRLKKHMLLDKLLDGCIIHPASNDFYCKKCNCVVAVDWNNNQAFCVVDGLICACVEGEEIKEPVTIIQNGKLWLMLGEEK